MKQSLLIIEENVAIRYLLTTVLGSEYKVIARASCYQAIKELRNRDVQAIVVNIEDANCRNFDFLLHLNSSSFYSNIPVIVLSTSTSSELRIQCLELGVEAFFLKPFDPLGLLECIKDVLFMSDNMRNMKKDFNAELDANDQILKVR
jgi:DNA-binding response OmpR family regulator